MDWARVLRVQAVILLTAALAGAWASIYGMGWLVGFLTYAGISAFMLLRGLRTKTGSLAMPHPGRRLYGLLSAVGFTLAGFAVMQSGRAAAESDWIWASVLLWVGAIVCAATALVPRAHNAH